MTIKQQGGIFGRNPTYNDVTVDNSLSVSGLSSLSIEDGSTNTTSFPLELTHTTTGSAAAGFGTGIKFFLENTTYSVVPEMATIEAVERSPAEIAGDLVFKTKWQNALAERASLKGRGGVSGVVDFNINAGNVIVANGYGIDFSATAGTGTSELFDDYEEGTWTPTLKALTTDFDSVTYDAIRSASYTKVGRVVQIQLTMRTDAITVGSATGLLAIGGLPFTPVTGNVGASSLSVSVGSTFASNTPMAAEVSGGANDIYLLYRSSVSGNTAYCQAADAATGANANYVRISGTYTTS